MIKKEQIKNISYSAGADICGIASQSRFSNAPKGFNPKDIYSKCNSVLVFAKRVPVESINAESCIPITHIANLANREVDNLTYKISLALQDINISNVIIPVMNLMNIGNLKILMVGPYYL